MALFSNKKIASDSQTDVKKTDELKAAKKTSDAPVSMQDLYGTKGSESKKSVKLGKGEKTSVKKDSFRILIKPLITEKATNLVSENKYAFIVALKANKIEIAKAVKAVYGVNPIKVNVINMDGKRVSRGRVKGQRSDFKKAIVTLKKGDSIQLYEGV